MFILLTFEFLLYGTFDFEIYLVYLDIWLD